MATPVEQREPMNPEKVREVMEQTTVEDSIVFNDRAEPLTVVEVDDHRIKAEGPKGGTKLLFPSPIGNTKSGDDPPQWRTNSTQPQRVWFFEIT